MSLPFIPEPRTYKQVAKYGRLKYAIDKRINVFYKENKK